MGGFRGTASYANPAPRRCCSAASVPSRWAILRPSLMLLASCSMRQNIPMAQAAVDEFHARLRVGEYDLILSDATPEFRHSIGEEALRSFLARVRNVLGAVDQSQLINLRVNHMPSGTFFFAQHETRFQKGSARENLTWRVENGKLRLVGYFVASPLLPATAPALSGRVALIAAGVHWNRRYSFQILIKKT